jgi:hypothetical protein
MVLKLMHDAEGRDVSAETVESVAGMEHLNDVRVLIPLLLPSSTNP